MNPLKNSFFFLISFNLWGLPCFSQGLLTQNQKKTEKINLSPYYDNLNPNLPSAYSLQEYVPETGEQGNTGMCVGWALAQAQTISKAIEGDWKNNEKIITNHSFSPHFLYAKAKNYEDENCEKGIELLQGLEVLQKIGNLKKNEFEQGCQQDITYTEIQKAQLNRIKSYDKIISNTSESKTHKINAIKQAIFTKQPVIVGLFNITNSFKEANKGFWKPNDHDHESTFTEQIGHALLVIGYDDNKYGGSVLLFNSWGKNWGNEGTIWVKYDDFANMCAEAYTIVLENENGTKFSADFALLGYEQDKILLSAKKNIFKTTLPMYENNAFQIMLKINKPLYVYAFGYDLTNKTAKIFPQNHYISSYFNDVSQPIVLPKKNTHWVLDGTKGKDYICILLSNEPLNFDSFLLDFENHEGEFMDKLMQIFGDKYHKLPINLSKSFDGLNIHQQILPNHKIMPLIVEIEHL